MIVQWYVLTPLKLSQLVDLELPSFTAIGVYAYLTALARPVTIKELDKASAIEHESEIGEAVAELIDAGLVVEEEIEEGVA